MKKSDIQILLVILGIAILVLGYLFGFKKEKEKLEEQEDINTTLRAQLTELQEKAKMKDQLLAETDEYNKLFDKELTKYPADLNQETAVAFMKGVEEQLEFTNISIAFSRPAEFYVLGQGTAAGTGVASSNDDSHEEFSILDKAGRVRLSAEMREAAGIDSNRVKIDIVDGKIIITNE